jgi:putative tricarboxylic transport membrane protein
VLVLADSLRVGIGWGDDGPRSGYFPFYIGLALLGASGWTAFKQLRRWRVHPSSLCRACAAGQRDGHPVPMVVYVGGIAVLGIYVASAWR